MAAKLPIITDVSALDATQVKLCHFFKCTYDFKQCYWTGNGYDMYMRHMKNKHGDAKYFCYMCEAPEKKNKIMMEREELFDHIVYNHGFRVFQCNLCLYRAARITHVEIHHCTNHPENYDAAVENKKDFVGVPSAVVICERTVCGPHPNEEVFFLHYRSLRVNKQLKFPHYQCLYCEFVAVEQLDVFQHIAESHRDFPLCLYDPTDNIEVLDGVETNGDSSIFSLSANPEMVRDADETIKAVAQDDLVMSGDEEQTNSALEEAASHVWQCSRTAG
ncbi:hypothetical protein HDE_06321 [Halotydeus destructor]|nr:hypothetical protein HDE_06321 [Halotydeus destructor]